MSAALPAQQNPNHRPLSNANLVRQRRDNVLSNELGVSAALSAAKSAARARVSRAAVFEWLPKNEPRSFAYRALPFPLLSQSLSSGPIVFHEYASDCCVYPEPRPNEISRSHYLFRDAIYAQNHKLLRSNLIHPLARICSLRVLRKLLHCNDISGRPTNNEAGVLSLRRSLRKIGKLPNHRCCYLIKRPQLVCSRADLSTGSH